VWRDPMESGIPQFDEQRRDLAGVIERHDIDPAAPIMEDNFRGRFSVQQVVMAEFFNREESLMLQLGFPARFQQRMIGDHNKILDYFIEVYPDSMDKKRRTAEEVYLNIREAVEAHMLAHGQELRRYIEGSA
jgi:hemerythrin